MPLVAVALGSNMGDRKVLIDRALSELSEILTGMRTSSVLETEPMYVEDQPAFLNAAVRGHCEQGPLKLLSSLKTIERSIGRLPRQRFGPREIDLDLVIYGRLSYVFDCGGATKLAIPHPRMFERQFVLLPLQEVWADLVVPSIGPISEMVQRTESARKPILA